MNPPTPLLEGLHSFKLPIPYPMKTVTVLVSTASPITLIDTGVNHLETQVALEAHLKTLGLTVLDLERVILTHNHPDHSGLSGWIQRQSGAKVLMLDHEVQDSAHYLSSVWFKPHLEHLTAHGLPPELAPTLEGFQKSRAEIDFPRTVQSLQEGESLELAGERFEVLWMPGHSDGHLTLWSANSGLLIAGDVLLERITPHIGLYARGRPDPLGDYLTSLERIVALEPRSTVVGHYGPTIEGGAVRANQIREHHHERLEHLQTLLERPLGGFEVSLELFRRELPASGRRFALTETLAHLEHLRLRGVLRREWVNEGWLYAKV